MMQGQNDIPAEKKRNRTWPVKFSDEEVKAFEEIKQATDRPIGYIIRELCLRGLSLYKIDGKLKEPQKAAGGSGGSDRPDFIEARHITLGKPEKTKKRA